MRTLKMIGYFVGGVVGVIYLLNPGAGVIEFIPDALPIVGNLDEAAAVGLVIACFQGIRTLRTAREAKALPEAASLQDERKAESSV